VSRSKARSAAPSAVTLGESTQTHAKVDWLTLTWLPEPDEHVPATILALLSEAGISAVGEQGAGHFGYQVGVRLQAMLDDGAKHQLALLDFGGERMGGRARLDLSGSACARIKDWAPIHEWISHQWKPTITRVDLAVDCLEGEYGVDDARQWLDAGDFTNGGRPPRHSTPGDWLSETPFYGRTLEIGRRENGKMLRAYEKGLQLAPGSGDKWTRFEVELRNKDREIPLDVIVNCDTYFAGAYECLQRVLPVAGERIPTQQKEGELSLQKLTKHCSEAYGRLYTVLRGRLDVGEVLDIIARPGVPRRLEKSSLAGFLASAAPAVYLKEDRP
jgi:phage replication initiation protein